MRSTIPRMTLEALFLLVLMLTFTACFYSEPDYYGPYGYGYAPSYVYGDYDERHEWHDRDWWVNNRHYWTHEHHPDWVAHETQEEHEKHAHRDHDYDDYLASPWRH